MGNCNLIGAFSSDTTLSTPVAINKGGTGQTTAQAALDALAAASGSLVQGDIFIVDASGNVVALARGSDNQTMVMNGSNPNWETVAAGGVTLTSVEVAQGSTFSTSSTSYVDVTGLTTTKPSVTDGKAYTTIYTSQDNTSSNQANFFALDDAGSQVTWTSWANNDTSDRGNMSMADISDADGSTIKGVCKTTGGTARFRVTSDEVPRIVSLGIG